MIDQNHYYIQGFDFIAEAHNLESAIQKAVRLVLIFLFQTRMSYSYSIIFAHLPEYICLFDVTLRCLHLNLSPKQDLIFTGEGSYDSTSAAGKVAWQVCTCS